MIGRYQLKWNKFVFQMNNFCIIIIIITLLIFFNLRTLVLYYIINKT